MSIFICYTLGDHVRKIRSEIDFNHWIIRHINIIIIIWICEEFWALIARCLAGVLNGNVAVLRTMIGEIAVEKRHQPLAFLTMPLLFNFGAIIGPAIGGSTYLTKPKEKSPYEEKEVKIFTRWWMIGIFIKFINNFLIDFLMLYQILLWH